MSTGPQPQRENTLFDTFGVCAVLDDSSEDDSPQPSPHSVSEDEQVPCGRNDDRMRRRWRNNADTAPISESSGIVAMKRRKIAKGSTDTLDSDDIICDQESCMEEYETLMRKVAEASKEQKAEEEASTAAMHAVDKSSIEADRVARLELKKATQQVQKVRKNIEDLGTSRCGQMDEVSVLQDMYVYIIDIYMKCLITLSPVTPLSG